MKYVGTLKVEPSLPQNISRIKELAYNLWWVWNYDAQQLFIRIDPDLWERVYHNPVKFLLEIDQKSLVRVSEDKSYLELYEKVCKEFDNYINEENTWFNKNFPEYKNKLVAYFSAEYGFHESLTIYSGGLGVLAGDHLKSASDIGLPLVGVGLLYKQGYFTQRINPEGWQEAIYYNLDFSQLPLQKVMKDGKQARISVDLPGRKVFANIWKVNVGRVTLILLDTNVPENREEDRWFTSQLYGGDQEMRITQEIFLGMGGVKALRELGYNPDIWHMNEGHSVFLGLERIRELVVNNNLSFYEALNYIRSSTIFTTHTPVPAGNDAFPLQLQAKYFKQYWESVKISENEFMDLGKEIDPHGYQIFSLTVLALKLAGRANGVSELHGHVSRKLWQKVWEQIPAEQNPITHITNGVHTESWLAPEMSFLFDKYLGKNWKENLNNKEFFNKIDSIPDEELWEVHKKLKIKMVDFVRKRAKEEWIRHGVSYVEIEDELGELLSPDVLTIGFARRFATYKRAILIFKDIERIKKILNNPDMPLQIVFAGKAHPKDTPGQQFIKQIFDLAKQTGFKGKIFFVEDYDLNVARYLVQGVDIWLNTPRRPLEASGTSGQKGPVNGIINFSVLDGWWREAFAMNPECGWSIGRDIDYPDQELQDREDALDIYSKLEKEIIPLYYERNEKNIPIKGVKKMKESIKTVLPNFSPDRMVKEYTQKLYVPSIRQEEEFKKDNYKISKEITLWKNYITNLWNNISIEIDSVKPTGDTIETTIANGIEISAIVRLGGIKSEDVNVEVFYRKIDDKGKVIVDNLVAVMDKKEELGNGRARFSTTLKPENGGRYEFTIRVVPFNRYLSHPYEMGLVYWLN
ncbi:MAG: alpha-glucan family phosphorylase [Brevinematales bacterium]|nr:alpha-glucan family phosphorylase [Brevinematales bacterium]